MSDLPGYDRWLERPFQRVAEESEAFLTWCETNELDPDDPKSFLAWEEVLNDDRVEAAADAYEAHLERIEWEREEQARAEDNRL
jgi:hypothetical protein